MIMEDVVVLIVGAGPAGLATSALLKQYSIQNIVLEKEDTYASLWKKRTYDRLTLHLSKRICQLPLMDHEPEIDWFMSKNTFLEYLDSYVSKFGLSPRYSRTVELASYSEVERRWKVEARNTFTGDTEVYVAEFLVVATGENNEKFIPNWPGLSSFQGKSVHSCEYKSGSEYKGKEVLVVGCGNSGMEISYDLSNHGASTSIVIRSPFHVLSKEIVFAGMWLNNYIKPSFVDRLMIIVAKIWHGDLSRFGIHQPTLGPFAYKVMTGKTPVIDVGTVKRIQTGEIKVLPGIKRIDGSKITFEGDMEKHFDAIIFATGYRSGACKWLRDYEYLLNADGMPKNRFPDHWKGSNGLYCVGFSRMGLLGIHSDSVRVAEDIKNEISEREETEFLKSL